MSESSHERKLSNQAEPKGAFAEKLELAVAFLANLGKVWGIGNTQARHPVLKLAFTTPFRYRRTEGVRAPI